MIRVIASVELKTGTRETYLPHLLENVPRVRAEAGCLGYEAMVDADSGLPAQIGLRDNVVTIIEAWESLEALQAHLKTPHMLSYRQAVEDYVQSVSLQVLQPV